MLEKTVNITNFIGTYDGYITKEECNKAIKLYEDQNKFNNTLNRIDGENSSILQKQDQQFFAGGNNIDVWWEDLKSLMINFDLAWNHYAKNVGAQDGLFRRFFLFHTIKNSKNFTNRRLSCLAH